MSEEIDQKCSCDYCKRRRRLKDILKKVENPEVEEFIKRQHSEINITKNDLEYEKVMRRAYSAKFGHISLSKATDIIKEKEDNESK